MFTTSSRRTTRLAARIGNPTRALVALAVAALTVGVATAAPATARPAPVRAAHAATSRVSGKSAHNKTVQFRSPSHNIYCHVAVWKGGNEARCDVLQHSYRVPPKPKWCHFDWPGSVTLSHKARFACVSDPATGSLHVRTLAYGSHVRAGHIRCTSRTTGVTCRNLRTGHGFKVSREAAHFF
jgi:hypothetical protein